MRRGPSSSNNTTSTNLTPSVSFTLSFQAIQVILVVFGALRELLQRRQGKVGDANRSFHVPRVGTDDTRPGLLLSKFGVAGPGQNAFQQYGPMFTSVATRRRPSASFFAKSQQSHSALLSF